MDPYSYVAPSRVKTLVCPFGSIKRNVFMQYYDRLASANSVRLVDVTPDGRPDRGVYDTSVFHNLSLTSHVFSPRIPQRQSHL